MNNDTLLRRLWHRYYGYQAFQGFRIPGGICILSFGGNMPGFSLASRHPKWSITWLWQAQMSFGASGGDTPWWRNFSLDVSPKVCRSAWIHLGLIHIYVCWQRARAYGPGHPGYDRKQWIRCRERLARQRTDAIVAGVYRAELARALEPAGED
jgi:hypothetical protein